MQIFVNTVMGETISIDVSGTVDNMKQIIEEIEGIPPEHQRLIFSGKEMEDGRSLESYNLKDQSTVHLTLDLPGGWMPQKERKLAQFHLLQKKICRKCYCRLPPQATRCRKAKCGKTYDIRDKKVGFGGLKQTFKRLSEWQLL